MVDNRTIYVRYGVNDSISLLKDLFKLGAEICSVSFKRMFSIDSLVGSGSCFFQVEISVMC